MFLFVGLNLNERRQNGEISLPAAAVKWEDVGDPSALDALAASSGSLHEAVLFASSSMLSFPTPGIPQLVLKSYFRKLLHKTVVNWSVLCDGNREGHKEERGPEWEEWNSLKIG